MDISIMKLAVLSVCVLLDLLLITNANEFSGVLMESWKPAGAAAAVRGMDVSGYQRNVNWTAAYSRGARFAYVKATEGTGYINPYFAQQYGGSFRAGMIRGAYHFARPDRSSGTAQANYFLAHGGRWSRDGRTLPGALDIEYNPQGPACYGLTQAQMGAWIAAFVSRYRAVTRVSPVIYSTADWYNRCVGRRGDFSRSCPLWVACYCRRVTSLPYNWKRYTIWQHASSGPFPGDQNIFNGSMDGLRRLANGTLHSAI